MKTHRLYAIPSSCPHATSLSLLSVLSLTSILLCPCSTSHPLLSNPTGPFVSTCSLLMVWPHSTTSTIILLSIVHSFIHHFDRTWIPCHYSSRNTFNASVRNKSTSPPRHACSLGLFTFKHPDTTCECHQPTRSPQGTMLSTTSHILP